MVFELADDNGFELGGGVPFDAAPGVEADAAAAPALVVGMPFVRRPRLASALDKLALTDSLLKLRRPLKLFGTFIGRPSITLDLRSIK